ncbi:MAG: glucosaminidase domain-containing protein [Cruoricaptor ignavus]|nr:glucosaminidase domain-containing protein [Cruoricaptor ignavus]
MKKLFLAFAILLLSKTQAQTWSTEEQYIQAFAQYAVEEMEKYQIPASITLAQGLLETGGGQSRLAKEGNNHFGIKCKEEWTGKTMKHTDDAPNECFRVYNDPRESYEDHSKFLRFRKYYQNLFKLDMKDYKAWAHGLKKAGYATNPRYAHILISKIEKHKLYEFDNTSSKETQYTILKLYPELQNDKNYLAKNNDEKKNITPIIPTKKTETKPIPQRTETPKSKTELLNGILVKNHPNGAKKFVIIPTETNIAFIAKKYGIKENKLIKWNDLNRKRLVANDIIFLEAKSNNGNIAKYTVKQGETMYGISQKFGIKLAKLYSKNRMNNNEMLKAGQTLYLQQKKPR